MIKSYDTRITCHAPGTWTASVRFQGIMIGTPKAANNPDDALQHAVDTVKAHIAKTTPEKEARS